MICFFKEYHYRKRKIGNLLLLNTKCIELTMIDLRSLSQKLSFVEEMFCVYGRIPWDYSF